MLKNKTHQKLTILTSVPILTLLVASCANQTGSVTEPVASTSPTVAPVKSDTIVKTVTNGSSVEAGTRVKISVKKGWIIKKVNLTGQTLTETNATSVDGTTTTTTWTSAVTLPDTDYVLETQAVNANGETVEDTRTFATEKSKHKITSSIQPANGTYGVGIIPKVVFNVAIPKAKRATVVSGLSVTTTPAPVAGSWRWLNDTTVAYRPETFWPANTAVTINANNENVNVIQNKNTYFGTKLKTGTFKTGRSFVINVNAKKHSGTATLNGKVVKKFGVSTGKAGYVTRSGIKTLTDKHRVQRMTNVGVTNDEVYDLQVPYAIRLTDTGEFMHGAPWNGNIGYANTSHGCTNLSLSNAKWLYNKALWGDPVVTTGTSRKMDTTNGPGAAWNIPYEKWAN